MIVSRSTLIKAGAYAALPVMAIGVVALCGWIFSVDILYFGIPGFVAMNPVTAFCCVLAAVALLLGTSQREALRTASGAMATLLFLLAGWQIVALLLGASVRPDLLLFRSAVMRLEPPALMVFATPISLAFAAVSTGALHSKRGAVHRLGEICGYAVGVVALFSVLAYAFGASTINALRHFAHMSIPTTVSMLLLSIGLSLQYNERGPVRLVVSRLSGGRMVRLMLPAALLVPMGLGLLAQFGLRNGYLNPPVALALLVTLSVTAFITLTYFTALAIEQREKELRAQHQLLHRSEARISAILAIAADAIISVDHQQRITLFNEWAEKIFGYKRSEVLGRPLEILIPQRCRAAHHGHVSTFAEGGVAARTMGDRGEIFALRKNGEEFPAEATVSRLSLQGEDIFTVVLRDVTERHRIEDELMRARDAAEAASHSKSEFLANMSHEIRTPLNSISGFTQLLCDRADLPADVRDKVGKISNSTSALAAVVNDILDYSKLEEGKMTLSLKPFSPLETVRDCIEIISSIAGRRELSISLDAKPGTERLMLMGDRHRIRQILLNLLSNAVKFTNEGGVTVTLGMEAQAGVVVMLRVTVTDTGIGIPNDRLGCLFERFSQVDGSMSRSYGGTGLGLAICRRLVGLMGGKIGVESQPGRGSTFSFCLPLAPAASFVEAQTTGAGEAGRKRRRTVLLVEDVELSREIAVAMLETAGHSVDAAANGGEALKRAAEKRYDLILMDIQMPDMDGFSVTRAIREGAGPNAKAPIIAMTANVLPEQVARFYAAGMSGHIGKPVERDELIRAVQCEYPIAGASAA